jgi:hypothetical protein
MDIEASGFGRGSYPIEVGYVLPDGRAWCTLVKPLPQWTHWDSGAEALHHIQRNSLLQHGRSPAEVASQLNQALAGLTVYCDGWAHDYTWLGALFDAAGQHPRFKLESAARLLDEQTLPRLDAALLQARQALHLQRHRASSDARVLQQALQQLTSPPRGPQQAV